MSINNRWQCEDCEDGILELTEAHASEMHTDKEWVHYECPKCGFWFSGIQNADGTLYHLLEYKGAFRRTISIEVQR